jgi:uncharacterized protein
MRFLMTRKPGLTGSHPTVIMAVGGRLDPHRREPPVIAYPLDHPRCLPYPAAKITSETDSSQRPNLCPWLSAAPRHRKSISNMSPHDRRIYEEFARCVREREPRARIWAFGSRARGEAGEFSDLDVCIVVPQETPELRQAIGRFAWEIGLENDVLIQDVIFSEERFTEGPMSASPLVKNIIREGIAA